MDRAKVWTRQKAAKVSEKLQGFALATALRQRWARAQHTATAQVMDRRKVKGMVALATLRCATATLMAIAMDML